MTIGVDVRPLGELRGGVYEYTRHLLKNLITLAGQNQECTILLVSIGARPLDVPRHLGGVLSDRIRAVHIRLSSKRYAAAVLMGSAVPIDLLVERACGVRPDIFLCPNGNFMTFSAGFPYILTIHDVSFELFADTYTIRQRLWHRLVNIPGLMRSASHLIAVSRKTQEDVGSMYGIPTEKMSVIPLGVDHALHPASGAVGQHMLSGRYIIGFGCENERKNMKTLLYAFAHATSSHQSLADVGLILVVTGSSGGDCAALVRDLCLESRVQIRGPLSDKERGVFLSRASLLVYPSLYEGFGLPPLEAARVGVPVLASWAGSIPEISGSFALLCDPMDIRSLAGGIASVLSDRVIASRCIQRGRESSDAYRWECTAQQTLSLLRSVAASRI